MIIDVHAHYTSAPDQLNAFRGRQMTELNRPVRGEPKISDEDIERSLQGFFRQMKERGIDKLIFSPRASGMGHEIGSEKTSVYWTLANNNLVSRACKMFPDRLIPGCMLPQSPGVSPKNCVEELERCVKELGFVSCNINPDVSGGGQPFTPSLGDEWWYPLYEKMVELDVVGMIHATSTVNPGLHVNGSHYVNQDSAAVFELCYSRVFQDFPKLKMIIAHGGGALGYQFNRYRAMHVSGKRAPFEEVVRNLYFDLAIYDQDSMEMLIRKVGVDRVMYASEMFGTAQPIDPKTGRSFDDTVSFIKESTALSDADKAAIFEGNARKLFTRAKF